MYSLDELLARLSLNGDSDRRERIERMLGSLKAGTDSAKQFSENLGGDSHWESLDELAAYVDRLLVVHESGTLDVDSHRTIVRETVTNCQARCIGDDLPRPGDAIDPPSRMAHAFALTDQNFQVHEERIWEILTTDMFNDPKKRALLAPLADVGIRIGARAARPYEFTWATFESNADHPFGGTTFKTALGALRARAVLEALGMPYLSGSRWAVACYSGRSVGQVRMPTICDGGWGEKFRVCGNTYPGTLPERLHRPVKLGELDRRVIELQ